MVRRKELKGARTVTGGFKTRFSLGRLILQCFIWSYPQFALDLEIIITALACQMNLYAMKLFFSCLRQVGATKGSYRIVTSLSYSLLI